MMRIDLHADDFGATRGVNANILEAWRAGALNSVSILANGDAVYEASKEVKSDMSRKLRLAVHLNLTEGRSVVDPRKLKLLVNTQGRFRHGFLGLFIRWRISGNHSRLQLARQVETEWREQIRRVIGVFSPRSISAVDSHIHVHMLPFLFPIAVRLAREFGLPEIRISREFFHFSFKETLRIGYAANVVKHILLNLLSRPARRMAEQCGLGNPDAIVGVLYSGRMTYDTALSGVRVARRRRLNWLEILFHPGLAGRDEAKRWSGRPGLAKFYLDPHRDVERDAIIRIGSTLR